MNFTNTLIKGKLVKRYKRFFADIEVNNKIVTAHCPNTGSMKGLLDEGNEVWISPQNDPSRKLKYTLELIKVKKKLVGVNTHRANRIVQHGLENKLISEFKNITQCPILVNTSFNVRGEPIVCTPRDAIKCFMGTNLDILVIEDFILFKEDQDKNLLKDYKNKFTLD